MSRVYIGRCVLVFVGIPRDGADVSFPERYDVGVSGTSDETQTASMLHLKTFGAIGLTRIDSSPLPPAAGQRRLVALLALLSASETPLSRDRVVWLLSPDGDPDRSRHALTQAMYHARRSLRCDDLFLPGPDLRLNPLRIGSDVRDLMAALARKDWTAAAAAYAGPFLDGFALPRNAEFEHWASGRREWFISQMALGFEQLAEGCRAAADSAGEVRWARRRAELDPLNSRWAAGLVEAMARRGDQMGAWRLAQTHAATLRATLEVEPDPAFVQLMNALRPGPVAAVAPRVAPADVDAGSPGRTQTDPVQALPQADPVNAAIRADAARSGRLSSRMLAGFGRLVRPWGARLVALTAAAAGVMAVATGKGVTSRVELDARIVVAPFRVSGADPEVRFLREGMIELLSARLGSDDVPNTVDPGTAIRAWRSVDASDDLVAHQAERLAHRLGASVLVAGSIVGTPRGLIISATLTQLDGRSPTRTATVEGPLDSLTALVDRLTVHLMILDAGETDRFRNHLTPSIRALRQYLAGQSAYRRGHYADAMRRYEAAVHEDSTFALAAMQLALVADRINAGEQHDRALAIAWSNRFDLSDRDRAHLEAFAGPRYPAPSPETEQLAAWEAALALSPDRAELWLELGERFLLAGRVLGLQDHERRAVQALSRSIELDPGDLRARQLALLLAARMEDTTRLRALVQPRATVLSADHGQAFVAWRVGIALADSAALRRIRASFPRLPDPVLRSIAMNSQFDAVGIDDADRALRLVARRDLGMGERIDLMLAQHSLALNRGLPVHALDLTEQLEDVQPGTDVARRLRVLDGLYGDGDTLAAAAAAQRLRARIGPPPAAPAARARELANRCVTAQWSIATGDLAAARSSAARLRETGMPISPVPVGANPLTCAELLDAALRVRQDARASRATLERLDSLMLSGPAAGDAATYAHIWIARMWVAVGDAERALQAIRRRPYMSGWPRYLATARREEAQLAIATGDSAAAVTVYRKFLAMRGDSTRDALTGILADRVREQLAGNRGSPR